MRSLSLLISLIVVQACSQSPPPLQPPSPSIGEPSEAYEAQAGAAVSEGFIDWAAEAVPQTSPVIIQQILDDAAVGYVADDEVPNLSERSQRYDVTLAFAASAWKLNSNAERANSTPGLVSTVGTIGLALAGGLMTALANDTTSTHTEFVLSATAIQSLAAAFGWTKKAEKYGTCSDTFSFYSRRLKGEHQDVLVENVALQEWKKYRTDEEWLFGAKVPKNCKYPEP